MLISSNTRFFYVVDFKLFIFVGNYNIVESVEQLHNLVILNVKYDMLVGYVKCIVWLISKVFAQKGDCFGLT